MHCRYAGDDFKCHFKLRKHQGSCIWFQEGRNCAVLWLLFAFMTLFFTYYRNYAHYYNTRICNSALRSLKKLGQRHSPSHCIRVSRKQKHKWLNQGGSTCPASLAGRQLGLRRPGRQFECRQASRRAWQDETDPPSHQQFWPFWNQLQLPWCFLNLKWHLKLSPAYLQCVGHF